MKTPLLKLIPPLSIWKLGISSGLINLSNLMVYSLMGVFSLHALGLTPFTIGLIEGIIDLFSWITRLLSGNISDYFRKRKSLIIIGYIVFISSRILLMFSHTVIGITFARLVDRIGYSLQAAPREALVGELSPSYQKGTSYGLRHALSIIGSVIGSLTAAYLLKTSQGDYYIVFLWAIVPAILALILLKGVPDTPHSLSSDPKIHLLPLRRQKIRLKHFIALGKPYWFFIFVTFLFALGQYSPLFLTLQAEPFGVSIERVPLVVAMYSLVEVFLSYPTGIASDHINRKVFVIWGFIILALTNYIMGFGTELWQILIGIILWGVQLGLTKGTFHTLIADLSPPHLRATAFGFFYFCTGAVYFVSNAMGGWLATYYSLGEMFIAKGMICLFSLLVVIIMKMKKVF